MIVRRIPDRGFGLFSSGAFKSGDIVLCEPIVVLPGKEWHHIHATALHDYYFDWKGFMFMPLGYVCLLSHSDSPNLDWSVNKKKRLVTFTAIKDIRKGEELTFDYG